MQNTMIHWFDRRPLLTLLAGGTLAFSLLSSPAEVVVKDGQKVAFLGDSITAGGWGSPGGYVRLVVAGLEANGLKVAPVPAGISGHKSNQMLERLRRDVLDKKPDWMTLSCGVNDVWHGAKGVPLDQYKTNITAILDQCQTAGVKVMILTATVIGEELDNDNNKKLVPYNDFLRELAKDRKCPLADLNAMFQEAIKASAKPGRALTSDGVHMNPTGDQLMAKGILRAFGLDDPQMAKAREAWLDIPGSASARASYDAGKGKSLKASHKITLRQLERLQALASRENQSLDDLLKAAYAGEVKAVLKPAGEYESAEAIFQAGKDKDVQAQLQEKFSKRVEELLKK
ncbi:MAG: SGNH/GDSL hydrolase family protein [Verrucomicrobia bacterium]|nr:SGNH/GDSL hydrolase family protein [Verrucomicrobiota bacterium]